MPRRDGTGPNGQGPRTGGQRGNCLGTEPKSKPNKWNIFKPKKKKINKINEVI